MKSVEEHSSLHKKIVKTHDIVPEMAMWVDWEHGSKSNSLRIQEALQPFRLEEIKKWKEAKRIFIC